MIVKELIARLDEFGDHLPVHIQLDDANDSTFDIGPDDVDTADHDDELVVVLHTGTEPALN